MITGKDLIEFNCRDHSAMVLQVFNPSKASDGLKELEYINGLPLLIRQIIRIKATLANLLFLAFLLAAHLIQGTYIIPDSRHFRLKMTENRDIDFLGDHSLPGITCFPDPIAPRKFTFSANRFFRLKFKLRYRGRPNPSESLDSSRCWLDYCIFHE